uniref:Uncharacterized protein n=1 Tax=Lotus japonicus TaxID=34305 RepID=I3T4T1_LOTJA|nr:unknown [Lotus japonicus]
MFIKFSPTFYTSKSTQAIYCNLKCKKLIILTMQLAFIESYHTVKIHTRKCLYFCSLFFALTSKFFG